MQFLDIEDGAPSCLKDKKIMMVGYGSQGRSHALNLRDSGVKDIKIGLYAGSKSIKKAQEDGFSVVDVAEGAKTADLVMLAAPDEVHAQIYQTDLAPFLQAGATLAFMHGLSIHFGLITPKQDINVIMIAPKAAGPAVRACYQQGEGVACLLAVAQDVTGEAKDLALSYARALSGGGRVLWSSFKEECEADLFGEQAVLCGGVMELVRNGFEVLVENGYSPEIAYFECLHELKLVVDLLHAGGFTQMCQKISNTAEWGAYTAGPRLINKNTKKEMQKILEEIQQGKFAREWMEEYHLGGKIFKATRKALLQHPIEEIGKKIRALNERKA